MRLLELINPVKLICKSILGSFVRSVFAGKTCSDMAHAEFHSQNSHSEIFSPFLMLSCTCL